MSATVKQEATAATPLPTYLNAALIASALENKFGRQKLQSRIRNDDNNAAPIDSGRIQVQKCDFKLATVVGENFCSAIYRAQASFTLKNGETVNEAHSGSDSSNCNGNANDDAQSHEISFIVKDLIMEIAALGSSELEMYNEILPEMTRILHQSLPQQNGASEAACAAIKLGPDCLYSICSTHETYVLEDLIASGYISGNRFSGADLPHAMVMIRKMAQFHAASMIYLKKLPADASILGAAEFCPDDFVFRLVFTSAMESALKAASQWPDFEDITTKMRANFNEEFYQRLARARLPENSRVCVINHGDLWINNILFSYDTENKPQNAIFVDFQHSFICSLGFDVNFLFYTSIQVDVLKAHRYELLRYYYAQLKATLQQCDATFAIPSWQTVMEEIRNCEVIGYFAVISEMPFCCITNDVSAGFSTDTFKDQKLMQQKFDTMYENKRVLDTVRWALDHFNELNILQN